MASRQCSSSCSISVTQCGRNLAKTSISRHNGSARSFSPIANIGMRLRSRHRINAVRLSPFPDRCETMEQAASPYMRSYASIGADILRLIPQTAWKRP